MNHCTEDDANQHVTQAEGSGEDYGAAAGLSEARSVQPCLSCVQTLHWLLFVWIYTCIRTADVCLLLLTSSNDPADLPAAASKRSATNHSWDQQLWHQLGLCFLTSTNRQREKGGQLKSIHVHHWLRVERRPLHMWGWQIPSAWNKKVEKAEKRA